MLPTSGPLSSTMFSPWTVWSLPNWWEDDWFSKVGNNKGILYNIKLRLFFSHLYSKREQHRQTSKATKSQGAPSSRYHMTLASFLLLSFTQSKIILTAEHWGLFTGLSPVVRQSQTFLFLFLLLFPLYLALSTFFFQVSLCPPSQCYLWPTVACSWWRKGRDNKPCWTNRSWWSQ